MCMYHHHLAKSNHTTNSNRTRLSKGALNAESVQSIVIAAHTEQSTVTFDSRKRSDPHLDSSSKPRRKVTLAREC